MLDEMKALVREKNICVLATTGEGKPYCSLMAYAANADCTEIYLATLRSTRKCRNITANPAVSLLIDTREENDRLQARALTVEGNCLPILETAKKQLVKERLLTAVPHLQNFLTHTDAELLCVTITSFVLLKGLTDAHYATL